jgi:hypothetical protein
MQSWKFFNLCFRAIELKFETALVVKVSYEKLPVLK